MVVKPKAPTLIPYRGIGSVSWGFQETSKISTQSICMQPGQASDASERQKWYKWKQAGINFDDNPNNTQLIVVAVETSGAFGKSARNVMEEIADAEKANGGTSYNEQQRRKQLSVQLQTLRAQCIVESIGVTYSITQKTSNTEQVPSSPSTNPDRIPNTVIESV